MIEPWHVVPGALLGLCVWFIHAYRTRRVGARWRATDPTTCEICGAPDANRECHGLTVCATCEGLLP